MSILRVFTFEADWGLPTTGPFALKLLAWLRLNGIAYDPAGDRLFVTGKYWPRLYEIALVPAEGR